MAGRGKYFSASYAEARQKFLETARTAGAAIETHVNPNARGANGEELALDAARFGDRDAQALFIVCSARTGTKASAARGARSASSARKSSPLGHQPPPCCSCTPSILTAFPISAG